MYEYTHLHIPPSGHLSSNRDAGSSCGMAVCRQGWKSHHPRCNHPLHPITNIIKANSAVYSSENARSFMTCTTGQSNIEWRGNGAISRHRQYPTCSHVGKCWQIHEYLFVRTETRGGQIDEQGVLSFLPCHQGSRECRQKQRFRGPRVRGPMMDLAARRLCR